MTDISTLSDDELLALDVSALVSQEDTTVVEQDSTQNAVQEPTEPIETQQEQSDTQVPDNANDSVEEPVEAPTEISDTDTTEVAEETKEIDYKTFYETLTQPIKANGRQMQLSNPDDMIRLMQMGANYSKKMEQLKPKQALLKVLAEHQLDNQEKLGYLIDLANKKPEAIAKLIKESNIDLYDFDTEQANDYSPNLEIKEPTAFEMVLDEVITNNPNMSDVIGFMGQWDNESKNIIYNEPNILKAIAEQKQSGLYDRIIGIVEQERLLGRMTDIPYLQAYSHIESQLLEQQNKQASFTAPRPKATSNAVEQKRKASIPNGNNQTTNNVAIEQMTDEQIMAMFQ